MNSRDLHQRAARVLPLGVTGDGRYASPYPVFFRSGHGKQLEDVDGNRYLDYHGGFGSAILGYSHPEVDEAVHRATREAGGFVGLPHAAEGELAERLCELIPYAERVALCGGGGSDGVYHAVRLARAVTGRTKIVKIEGGYHGWHADVGVSTRPDLQSPTKIRRPEPVPNSAGSLSAVTSEVLVTPVNDTAALAELFDDSGSEIAGFIIEPVLYSSGCVLVEPDYLALARRLCSHHGALLIFDEVMSGFRSGLGGAGGRLSIDADLGVFGKAVANGYVIAVLAGRAYAMRRLAPEGDVFYSGTFNGHPLSVAAAYATLAVLERDDVPARIDALGHRLAEGVNSAIRDIGANAVCQTFGSVWNLYFGTRSVRDYRDLAASNTPATAALNAAYHAHLRENGIYVHKRHVNRAFVSALHDEGDIDRTVEVIREFVDAHRDELAR